MKQSRNSDIGGEILNLIKTQDNYIPKNYVNEKEIIINKNKANISYIKKILSKSGFNTLYTINKPIKKTNSLTPVKHIVNSEIHNKVKNESTIEPKNRENLNNQSPWLKKIERNDEKNKISKTTTNFRNRKLKIIAQLDKIIQNNSVLDERKEEYYEKLRNFSRTKTHFYKSDKLYHPIHFTQKQNESQKSIFSDIKESGANELIDKLNLSLIPVDVKSQSLKKLTFSNLTKTMFTRNDRDNFMNNSQENIQLIIKSSHKENDKEKVLSLKSFSINLKNNEEININESEKENIYKRKTINDFLNDKK